MRVLAADVSVLSLLAAFAAANFCTTGVAFGAKNSEAAQDPVKFARKRMVDEAERPVRVCVLLADLSAKAESAATFEARPLCGRGAKVRFRTRFRTPARRERLTR
jgi:hypothetical protein